MTGCCSCEKTKDRLQFVVRSLASSYGRLGRMIGNNPGYFIVVPFLISLVCITGFQRLRYEDDPEYLFSPVDGRSKEERVIVEKYFPLNYSGGFNLGRMTRQGRFARSIIVAKDGGSILRKPIIDEINLLNKYVHEMEIEWDEGRYKYEDMCAKTPSGCLENEILDLTSRIDEILNGTLKLQYPLMIDKITLKSFFFPAFLGGVTTDDEGNIVSAKAMQLFFALDNSNRKADERAALWELEYLKRVNNTFFRFLSVSKFVSITLKTELENNTLSVVPYIGLTVVLMISFSLFACMMCDQVRSKPWLGFVGFMSAVLGVGAAFGVIMYCGLEFIGINLASPFLMLGVGLDDAFVILGAWRRSDRRKSIPDRMAEAYSEAACSITITSLTNFIAFLIGTATPFPSVRIFCIYTATATLFTFVYQLTLFGGALAISARAEQKNLHGFFCVPVIPKSRASEYGCWFKICCAGGNAEGDPNNSKDSGEHGVMVFFRDYFARVLDWAPSRTIVLMLFLLYLAVGIWGCFSLQEGLERRNLSRDDSYSVKFYEYEHEYFRNYTYRIQVIIDEPMDYSTEEAQKRFDDMVDKFQQSRFVANMSLSENWLSGFRRFLADDSSFIFLQDIDPTTKEGFIRAVRDVFLAFPFSETLKYDLVFNDEGTEIVASRIMIQTERIADSNEEREMLLELRRIASSFDFSVTVYHQYFVFFDQFILVRDVTIKSIAIAAAVMLVVLLIFIPSITSAAAVALTIVSIEVGVMGFMSLWGVRLDSISMINLIMCIGFSVDYSAHIAYAYLTSDKGDPSEKMRDSLHSLGLPITQGSISTILGIISLAFAPSYIFLTFFKTVFLVIAFGAAHGLLLLPVLLSMTDRSWCLCCSSSSKEAKIAYPPHYLTPSINGQSASDKVLNGHIYIPRLTYSDSQISTIDCRVPPSYGNGRGYPPVCPKDMKNGSPKMDKDVPIAPHFPAITDLELDNAPESKRSSTTDEGSAEKDLGLGTSAEECSEGSWKEVEDGPPQYNIARSSLIAPERHVSSANNSRGHLNTGYVTEDENCNPNGRPRSNSRPVISSSRISTYHDSQTPPEDRRLSGSHPRLFVPVRAASFTSGRERTRGNFTERKPSATSRHGSGYVREFQLPG